MNKKGDDSRYEEIKKALARIKKPDMNKAPQNGRFDSNPAGWF
jgi:hypothetical protein